MDFMCIKIKKIIKQFVEETKLGKEIELNIEEWKMKKILIIEASPRNGYCKAISDDILKQLGDIYELDLISLRDLNIDSCTGCSICLFAGSSKCPLRNDDVIIVLEKMMWADGIIFVVPNYSLGVPALLKNLFDRLAYLFHRPRLFHKVILPVIVQGVIGGKKIADYINKVMGYWGMNPVKGVVVTGGVYLNKEKSSQLIQKDKHTIGVGLKRFSQEINRTKVKSPSNLSLIVFRMARTSIKYGEDALPPDKAYYQKLGWFESNYYYDVKLNPFRKIVGICIDKIAKRMVMKV